jgi:hypothetical protein
MLGRDAEQPGHETTNQRCHPDQQIRFGDRVRLLAATVQPAQVFARKLRVLIREFRDKGLMQALEAARFVQIGEPEA